VRVAAAILEFFLARHRPGLALHCEMIPDRFPEALRAAVRRFPAGCLQFEVGVQTLSSHVAPLISRRLDETKLEENITFLRSETEVHVHADLIAGLPAESEQDFAAGFDRLVALRPHEIQIELLKRLRGTPITRHEDAYRLVFSPEPPYEILSTSTIDFATMRRLHRFARYWDLIANSGNFCDTLPLLWRESSSSPYRAFAEFSDWLYRCAGRNHALALVTIMELVFRYLIEQRGLEPVELAHTLWRDYQRGGRSDRPTFLLPFVGDLKPDRRAAPRPRGGERQARHRPEG